MESVAVDVVQLGVAVYVAGVLWGLTQIDARPMTRIAVALLWPLGPLAFIVTIAVLFAASLVAFPVFGAAVLIAGVATWLFVM